MKVSSLKLFTLSFVLVLSTLLFSSHAKAEPPKGPVFFSELMWRGSSVSTADEWIELYNSSDEIVDLSGWVVYNDAKDEGMVEIEKGQIAPRAYFLISNNDKDHEFKNGESVLDIAPDIIDSGVSLSNSEFSLSLMNASGDVVDKAGDGRSPFF